MNDAGGVFKHRVDFTSEFEHREFVGVPEVEWSDGLFVVHQGDETADEVAEKAKGACLRAVAEDSEGFFEQGLLDEGGDDPSIIVSHPGAKGVEDARDANFDVQVSMEGDSQRLCVAFGFIVD